MNWYKELGLDGISTPIDELWNYSSGVAYHDLLRFCDRDTAKEIIKKMPNLVKKTGGLPLDVLADNYGFEDAEHLFQSIRHYVPKNQLVKRLQYEYNMYMEENS